MKDNQENIDNRMGYYAKQGFNQFALAVFILLTFIITSCQAQSLTNLFFLHHSVGNGLVVGGDMRGTIAAYNSTQGTHFGLWDHGYNSDGLRNPAGEETGTNYDIPGDNTDPDGLHDLWTSAEADWTASRDLIMANHEVIAFKSCYPASHIYDADTLNVYQGLLPGHARFLRSSS